MLISNRRVHNWNSGFCLMILAFCFCIFSSSGCASLKEKCKGFLGVSTKALEESRADAITRTFNFDYNTCYDKVKAALIETESYIYSESKPRQMIAVYVTMSNTTPVGVFFKAIDASHTELQFASPSTNAKEIVCKNVFSVLDGTYKPKEKKGTPDENKETGY